MSRWTSRSAPIACVCTHCAYRGLPQRTAEIIEAYGPKLAEESLHEVVLHRLRPQDLSLADVMGLQPSTITVTPQGLVVGFEAKQAR